MAERRLGEHFNPTLIEFGGALGAKRHQWQHGEQNEKSGYDTYGHAPLAADKRIREQQGRK